MGLYGNPVKQNMKEAYQEIREYLKPKDGFLHVIMLNCFGEKPFDGFEADAVFTGKLDQILTFMQLDDYEIVGIQTMLSRGDGVKSLSLDSFKTQIVYR